MSTDYHPLWESIAVIVFGAGSVALFTMPLISTVGGVISSSEVNNISHIVFFPMIGILVFFIVCLLYFLQNESSAMYTIYAMTGIILALSYSAIALSAITN